MKLPIGYIPGKGGVEKASGFGGYGQKMLEKMGWAKGQGLGSNKDGIKEAIEVKKKEDTLGVRGRERRESRRLIVAVPSLLMTSTWLWNLHLK